MIEPAPTVPSGPLYGAPTHHWAAHREALCLGARHASSLPWSFVQDTADAFARAGRYAPLLTRPEWEGLLAAFRANPAWDEGAAVHEVARLILAAEEGARTQFAAVDQWPGLGRLLVDTPRFATQVRRDAELHRVLWQCAVSVMDTLAVTDPSGNTAWPRFAALVLTRAGTEGRETLQRWRQRLTQRAETLIDAEEEYVFAERTRPMIPPVPWLAATLIGQETPAAFAEAVHDTLSRQPLVTVLALVHATAAQWAAVDPAITAEALTLPGLPSRWRLALLTAAGARGVDRRSRRAR